MTNIIDGHRYGKQVENKQIDYIQNLSLTIKEIAVKILLEYHFPVPNLSHTLSKKKT